jgi:polyhydroxyalkanoate synthesis regulator protein
MNDKALVLKLYRSNRRMYSYAWHRHTNAKELLPLLRAGTRLEVSDQRTNGRDVTRRALLAILMEIERDGQPLITQAELEQILARPPGKAHE